MKFSETRRVSRCCKAPPGAISGFLLGADFVERNFISASDMLDVGKKLTILPAKLGRYLSGLRGQHTYIRIKINIRKCVRKFNKIASRRSEKKRQSLQYQ